MSKILELADAYAKANRAEANVLEQGTDDELVEVCNKTRQARAALVAEVEKLEAENAKLNSALEDILFHVEEAMRNEVQPYEIEMAAKRARAVLGETK